MIVVILPVSAVPVIENKNAMPRQLLGTTTPGAPFAQDF
jgi:hypothetical protein